MIVDSGNGRIVGAHLFGPSASELINLFAVAMRFGATAEQLKSMVFAYPTLGSTIPYLFG